MKKSLKERLYSHTKPENTCIIWIGGVCNSGYGTIKVARRTEATHRLAYTLANGPIPLGKVIRHTCNKRRCINPDHLLIGTQQENIRDSILDGTFKKSSRILSLEQVRTIRSRLHNGERQRDLAREYGTCISNISQIKTGYSWKGI